MSKIIHAVYENGVFKPTEALDLPDHCQVEFKSRLVTVSKNDDQALEDVYAVLSESLDGGEFDDTARHNEHAEPMSDALAKVYEVLGRSHHSGHWDDAERHNEHQP